MNKALCLIPARGGSKGLPNKNRLPLGGIPLIAHTIRLALRCDCFDRVVVSTDDPDIAAISEEHGALVPFLRPVELSDDLSPLDIVVEHALQHMAVSGHYFPVLGLMLPTSPFRSRSMVENLTYKCLREGYRCASTVRLIDPSCYVAPDSDGSSWRRLQDANRVFNGPYFRHYGVYQARKMVPNLPVEPLYYHTLRHPAEWVDIDTARDLLLAEKIIENKLYNFDYEL